MTTPQERLRALKWGFELLGEVAVDLRLEAAVRSKAKSILEIYPYLQVVSALRHGGALGSSEGLQRGLDEAREIFAELRSASQTPDDVKQNAFYVQRHYPTPGSWRWLGLPDAEHMLRDWFELPDTPSL